MDSFTLAVVAGMGGVIAIFVALLLMDRSNRAAGGSKSTR